MDNLLSLQNVSAEYASSRGIVKVLENISLDVRRGAFVTFLGPSGCGKTTLLNIVAGFVQSVTGSVSINGKLVAGPGNDRAMIFQNDSVFPWLTVEENIAFGLRNSDNSAKAVRERVNFFLDLSGLTEFARYYPKQLSGGMRKRVDIARAFAVNPPCILADEPFGSLDGSTKLGLYIEMMKLWAEEKNTIIFVTHDVEEAVFLSDHLYLLSQRPARIFANLAVPFKRPRNPGVRMSTDFQNFRTSIVSQFQ